MKIEGDKAEAERQAGEAKKAGPGKRKARIQKAKA
jgi:hypothetical protein